MPSSSAANRGAAGAEAVSVDQLSQFYIFRGLSPEKLSRIASIIELKGVAEGEVVIKDGDEGDTFYLLLEGEGRPPCWVEIKNATMLAEPGRQALPPLDRERHLSLLGQAALSHFCEQKVLAPYLRQILDLHSPPWAQGEP